MNMVSALLNLILIALLVFLSLVLINGRRIFAHGWLLALFFGVYFVDNFLILLANSFSHLQIIPNHIWEGFLVCGWSGKLYSILFAVLLFPLARSILTKEEAGWVLRHREGSLLLSTMIILALASWALLVGFNSPKGKFDVQTLLYLAVMPGLNEELIYRGYLLGTLDKLMPEKFNLLNAPFGWGVVVSSLLFGLLHGFWLDDNYAIHIEMIAFRNSAIAGFIFAWLKKLTGSLLAPIIAHGLEDVIFFLPRMF